MLPYSNQSSFFFFFFLLILVNVMKCVATQLQELPLIVFIAIGLLILARF